MASLLSQLDRQVWLARIDHTDPLLVEFGRSLADLCETALERTGRELPVEHAAVILLRAAAETESNEAEERIAA